MFGKSNIHLKLNFLQSYNLYLGFYKRSSCNVLKYRAKIKKVKMNFLILTFVLLLPSMKNVKENFVRFSQKIIQHQKNVVLGLSILIGVLAGMAAVILKNAVHYVEEFVLSSGNAENQNYLYLVLPGLGLLLTWLFVHYLIKEDIGHGVSRILQAISKKSGRIKRHNTYSSMVGCSMTVGFGGSAGMEAPILYTGAAIGSNIAMLFKQNYRFRVLLMGAGVAGAMAAIFKAPIAGIIFAVEVLMIDMAAYSVLPIVGSAVTGALVSTFLLGEKIEFYFTTSEPFNLNNFHWYLVLGVFCGIVSLYFLFINEKVENILGKLKSPLKRVGISALLIGILIFVFPPLFGEGYTFMKLILSGNVTQLTNNSFFYEYRQDFWVFAAYLFMILVFKVFATSLTTGSGGIGGVFAPSLFMGGIAGAFFSRLINHLSIGNISESNFTLVGMAGIIAGVVHAPMTAIFLIAEITGGYALFIPLIITSALSYLTVNIFRSHSIYTKKLALKGELLTHDKDKAVLTLLNVREVIETNFISVQEKQTLRDLVGAISKSSRNFFPVLDENKNLKGVVALDDVRPVMFNRDLYDTVTVQELMIIPEAYVSLSDHMEVVMQKFNSSGLWNMPVVNNGVYVGFVSRSNVFNYYRKKLVEFSEE
jgi:chloride channel protein, CIC family